MIKVILIDIDNTLLDFNKCAEESMKLGFKKCGLIYERHMFDVFTNINNYLWQEVEKGIITKKRLLEVRWNLIFKELGIIKNGQAFEKIFESLLAESSCAVTGAVEMLKYLSEKYRIFIVTNGFTSMQINRIKLAGMYEFADDIIASQSIGFSKPSKEFFDYCLNKIGNIKKEEILIIGDSLTADIKGGIDYGIHTCWYNYSGIVHNNDMNISFCITKLSEITNFL